VNRDEAKNILLIYRPGTADAADPQIAGALALAERDLELKAWLAAHCARQAALREKFRQLGPPAGLKEKILSAQAAREKIVFWRPWIALAAAAVILALGTLTLVLFPKRGADDTLAVYQNRMAGVALRGYGMDLATNDQARIRAYLAQNQAPADFALPPALKQAALVGCGVEGWQNTKVSMICFHTGRADAADGRSDLWLFVVDGASVKGAPAGVSPRISKVNRLVTATWTQDGRLYMLGSEGGEETLKKYL
jgi:hypothetical protein